METAQLELPSATPIELHVTSLDVTHSFWAYELGVKADAVAGVDNIAFVHPRAVGSFWMPFLVLAYCSCELSFRLLAFLGSTDLVSHLFSWSSLTFGAALMMSALPLGIRIA